MVPSIRSLQASQAQSKHNRYNPDCAGAVVIGNPKLPGSVSEQWQWGPLPGNYHVVSYIRIVSGPKRKAIPERLGSLFCKV